MRKLKNDFFRALLPQKPSDFAYAMELIDGWLEDFIISYEEKLIFLNYAASVVGRDLAASLAAMQFYGDCAGPAYIFRSPFPKCAYNENGDEVQFCNASEHKVNVDISKAIILALPWQMSRTQSSLVNLSEHRFRYIKENHIAYYLSDINICVVESGNHSITVGKHFGDGFIQATPYHTELALPLVKCDGERWIYTNGLKKPDELCDFRLGILFEISRRIFNVKQITQRQS